MFRKLLAIGCGAAALAFANSASAVTWTSLLEYRDAGSPTPAKSATPYGSVTIEDGIDFGDTVQVTVNLTNANSLFINTGGPHDPFLYNLTHAAGVEIINGVNQNFYDGGRTSPAAFEATPFGDFTNKIGCCSTLVPGQNVVSGFHFENKTTTVQVLVGYVIIGYSDKNHKKPIYDYNQPIYQTQTVTTKVKVLDYTWVPAHYVENNGAANGIKGPLTFYLHDSSGITFAGAGATFDPKTGKLLTTGAGNDNHFFSNTGGWWFTADIYDGQSGKTYNVAAKDAFRSVLAVPEPASWALMIMGFGAAGAVLRRRRAALA